jgi:hypothetical protein
MNRILSWLGCSGLTRLAILYALGVTETIKYVGPLDTEACRRSDLLTDPIKPLVSIGVGT